MTMTTTPSDSRTMRVTMLARLNPRRLDATHRLSNIIIIKYQQRIYSKLFGFEHIR